MRPAEPTIDDNSNGVALGTWHDRVYNVEKQMYEVLPIPKPISINPIKQAIRIEIIPRTLAASNVPSRMPIDHNSQHVSGALTHDANQTLTPLSADIIGSPTIVRALRADVTIIP